MSANDLAFLSQSGNGLVQELLLFPIGIARIFGKLTQGPAEGRQHFLGMVHVK
jgi:hypothetical protein